MVSGRSPWCRSAVMRPSSAWVLPVPAPPSTMTGPSGVSDAKRCTGSSGNSGVFMTMLCYTLRYWLRWGGRVPSLGGSGQPGWSIRSRRRAPPGTSHVLSAPADRAGPGRSRNRGICYSRQNRLHGDIVACLDRATLAIAARGLWTLRNPYGWSLSGRYDSSGAKPCPTVSPPASPEH